MYNEKKGGNSMDPLNFVELPEQSTWIADNKKTTIGDLVKGEIPLGVMYPFQYLATTRIGQAICSLLPTRIANIFKTNFNPPLDQIKKDKPPIILLHGLGANETQFFAARKELSDDECGSVLTRNLDKLLGNDPKKSIEDYAKNTVEWLLDISKKTGIKQFNLVGHSMGGLVAARVAKLAKKQGIEIKHFLAIATPWHPSPTMKMFLGTLIDKNAKHVQEMMDENGYLTTLREETIEEFGDRLYIIKSSSDWRVPDESSEIDIDPMHIRDLPEYGHNTIAYATQTWALAKLFFKQ